MSITKDFGAIVGKLRKEKGMTQKELAEKLYVTASAVSKWENKGVIPDGYILKELASIFDVSIEELLGSEEKSKVDVCEEQVVQEEKGTVERVKKAKLSMGILLTVGIAVVLLALVVHGIRYKHNLSKNTFNVVDEFYDDTSKYWGYKSIYHVVVVYEGELDSDIQSEYVQEIREDYSKWYEKVEVIIVSFFEEYDKSKDSVYGIEKQSFLLPLN